MTTKKIPSNDEIISNIEIKARLDDFQSAKEIAEKISDKPCETLYQDDTFFNSTQGRLKLRIFNDNEGELIFYERDETKTPKKSFYVISKTQDAKSLKLALTLALEIKEVIRKKRMVYLVGQTRIHLDEVEELGSFIELEFVMKQNQQAIEGQNEVNRIMNIMGISQEDLIVGAYADLLKKDQKSHVAGSGV